MSIKPKRNRAVSEQDTLNAMLRTDFYAFVRKAFSEIEGDEVPDGRYLEYVCHHLEDVVLDKTRKLAVSLPPQHLKSFVAGACLIAHALGRRPQTRILIVAGTESLARDMLASVRLIMRATWYHRLWNVKLDDDPSRTALYINGRKVVRARSIDGNFTGSPAEIIVIDDPVNISDSANRARLDEVNRKFTFAFQSRKSKGNTRMIVIAHRLSEHDLIGRLETKKGWKLLKLPMVAERNETYHHPNGRPWHRKKGQLLRPGLWTEDEIEDLRDSDEAPGFEALFQQSPERASSAVLQVEDFSLVEVSLKGAPKIVSVDPAWSTKATADYSVIHTYAHVDDVLVLVDEVRGRWVSDSLEKEIRGVIRAQRPSVVLIDDSGGGGRPLASHLVGKAPIVECTTTGNRSKMQRLKAALGFIKSGRVRFSSNLLPLGEILVELTSFPNGDHDDRVDCLTQVILWLERGGVVPSRPEPCVGVYPRHLRPLDGAYRHRVLAAGNKAVAALSTRSQPHFQEGSAWEIVCGGKVIKRGR